MAKTIGAKNHQNMLGRNLDSFFPLPAQTQQIEIVMNRQATIDDTTRALPHQY